MSNELAVGADARVEQAEPFQFVYAPAARPLSPSGRWCRIALTFILFALATYALAWTVRIAARKYYVFAASYVRWAMAPPPAQGAAPTHIFFLFVDHFEPGPSLAAVSDWASRYRVLAARHRDDDGRPPRHTWFYPGEQRTPEILDELRGLTADGLGEVEMHFHHGWDNAETLRNRMTDAIAEFQTRGFLKTVDGRTAFSFVHGNSGLDNSDGVELCGVSTELRVLRALGCFADFTFPSLYDDAQPSAVNRIYAARDDEDAKSYTRPLPLSTLRDGSADLMIFEGPLIFARTFSLRRLFFELDDGNIHPSVPASEERVDRWVHANIHVPERPDWVFVKIFAHGVSSPEDAESALGPDIDRALSYAESRYNDHVNYVLHYVTAREAYNLARAAADGVTGDPRQYFDYIVRPYLADAPRAARSATSTK